MPTASQSLLTKRTGSSPRLVKSKTMPSNLDEQALNVNKLTVQFPKVYLDQRYGHSLLRSEFGDYLTETSNIDKLVKEFIRTGDKALEVPFHKNNSVNVIPIQRFNQQAYVSGQNLPTKLTAKEFLPIRRKDSTNVGFKRSHSDSHLEVHDGDERAASRVGDYVEAEDVFHSGMRFRSDLSTDGDNNETRQNTNDYVYFQVEPFSDGSDDQNSEDSWPNINELSYLQSPDLKSETYNKSSSGRKRKDGNVFRLRRIEVATDDNGENTVELFIDDSDPDNVKIYRMSNNVSSLVQVKNAEIRQATDGSHVLINTQDNTTSWNSQATEDNHIEFSKIIPRSDIIQNSVIDGQVGTDTGFRTRSPKDSAKYSQPVISTTITDIKHPDGSHSSSKDNFGNRSSLMRNRKGDPDHTSGGFNQKHFDYETGTNRPYKSFLPSVSPNVSFAEGTKGPSQSSPRAFHTIDNENKELYDSLSMNYQSRYRQKNVGNLRTETFNKDVSFNSETSLPDQPYLSQENSFLSAEATETGALPESSGLSRLEQLSVEKKLKYLEPPVYFYEQPEPRPLALTFDYTGTDLTHVKIIKAVMVVLENIPDAKVTSLQFVARNVILGTMWVDNRWILKLSTKQCVTVLLGRGIYINGEQIKLRRLDDIIKEDYAKFLQNKDKFNKKGKKNKAAVQHVNALNLLQQTTGVNTTVSDLLGEQLEPREQSVF